MITWLLSLIPEMLWNAGVIASFIVICACALVDFIPGSFLLGLTKFKNIAVILAAVVLGLSSYMSGLKAERAVWNAKVEELQKQLEEKNNQSEKVTEKIVIRYKDKVKVVKEKGDEIIKEIPVYITKEVDSGCKLTPSVSMLHNAAARNELPKATRKTDGETAKTSDGK